VQSALDKELSELREFTRYEKEFRDASILAHQEVSDHFRLAASGALLNPLKGRAVNWLHFAIQV